MSASPENATGRKIEVRLAPASLAPQVLPALHALGYCLDERVDASDPGDPDSRIWLVDEVRLDEIPAANIAPDSQILLIAGPRHARRPEDERILARVSRPARLSDVYSMIQIAMETTPRKTPRVPIQLSARWFRADRQSIGAVLSLSEGGCLLGTAEDLHKDARLDLQFALPEHGLISTAAECRYTRQGQTGLAFLDLADGLREAIARFVTQQLAKAYGVRGRGEVDSACPA